MAKQKAEFHGNDRRAEMIVAASLVGDEQACERYHVSKRTLQRYKKQMETDPALALVVARKKSLSEKNWAAQVDETVGAIMGYLKRSAEVATAGDPEVIHAMAGALRMIGETEAQRKILDVRINSALRQAGEAARSLPAKADGDSGAAH